MKCETWGGENFFLLLQTSESKIYYFYVRTLRGIYKEEVLEDKIKKGLEMQINKIIFHINISQVSSGVIAYLRFQVTMNYSSTVHFIHSCY